MRRISPVGLRARGQFERRWQPRALDDRNHPAAAATTQQRPHEYWQFPGTSVDNQVLVVSVIEYHQYCPGCHSRSTFPIAQLPPPTLKLIKKEPSAQVNIRVAHHHHRVRRARGRPCLAGKAIVVRPARSVLANGGRRRRHGRRWGWLGHGDRGEAQHHGGHRRKIGQHVDGVGSGAGEPVVGGGGSWAAGRRRRHECCDERVLLTSLYYKYSRL